MKIFKSTLKRWRSKHVKSKIVATKVKSDSRPTNFKTLQNPAVQVRLQHIAAKLGKRVAIIDRQKMIGGVSLHMGTIPSKTLREAVLYLTGFRQRSFFEGECGLPGPHANRGLESPRSPSL